MPSDLVSSIEQDGFIVVPGVLDRPAIHAVLNELQTAFDQADATAGPIRNSREQVTASRNLLRVWSGAIWLAQSAAIAEVISGVLGPNCGLVRALYFDKPPGRSWSLPWHKDMTVALKENAQRGTQFGKPTVKAGVPHMEAPESVLRQMLTARIHLDDVTDENGPLLVIPGSHHDGKESTADSSHRPVHTVLATAGDVLLMRPLVSHCSQFSRPGTPRHRRTIHLEFAAGIPLPDGYEWHEFHPIAAGSMG